MNTHPTKTYFVKIITASLASLFLLSACGGSGGSNSTVMSNPVNTVTQPDTGSISPVFEDSKIQIYGSEQAQSGKSIGFALIPKTNSTISSVTWLQTSGDILTILAPNSQTIGFDVPSPGNYSLSASVSYEDNTETTYNLDFSASSSIQTAGIRLDHTVTELGKVSLHVGAPSGRTVASVTWEQIAGPEVQNLEQSTDFLFFDAPSVTKDSLVSFRADIAYTDGSNDTDDVLVTIKNVNFDTDGLFYSNNFIISEDMFAYRSNSPFKESVERCVYSNNVPSRPDCTFTDLPLIGTSTNGQTPSVEDVLNRTLVSHPWMGQRFEEYLTNSAAGNDMLNLLRGVTAVVISYDVRPSFYWAATGAIYLDANNFWQTPQERDTLNDIPDFRSDFGSDLQFRVFWRYTKDNDYYPSGRYTKNQRSNRTFDDLEASISWLMYHELAHANDFFPSNSWLNVSATSTPLNYVNSAGTNSDVLDVSFPLRSDEMHALADVRFRNETPTATQRAYNGQDVAGFFEPDIAPSFYAYLTTREDFATLFERYMMLYRLDSEADVAIIDGETENDFIVAWGQRNRITLPELADRTEFVVNRVFPELQNVRSSLTNMPEPVQMDESQGWFGNLDISPSSTNIVGTNALAGKLQQQSKDQVRKLTNREIADIHEGRPALVDK